MPELNWNVILSALAYAALTGIFNLIFARKSQIEAWAESRPRLAALLKLSRSLGFDPWNAISALSLFFAKKLPDVQKSDSPIAKAEQRKADAKRLADEPVSIVPPGTPLLVLLVAGLLGLSQQACNRDARPCSAEDLTSGPLAAHNAQCAANRQARFPNMSDDDCTMNFRMRGARRALRQMGRGSLPMSLPKPLETVALKLAEKAGEAALEALLNALLGARDPVTAVEKATILALSKQSYRRPDLKKGPT